MKAIKTMVFYRLILAALLALSLGACSSLSVFSLAYNNASTVIVWRAQDYLELEPPLKSLFAERVEKMVAWHRREQLPEYIKFLRQVQEKSQGRVTQAEVTWLVRETQARYRLLAVRLAQEAGDLAVQLSADNLKALDARLIKSNEEFALDYLKAPPEAVRKRRAQRIIDNLETWLGSLTDAQKAAVHAQAAQLPMNYALVFEERKRRQAAIRQILANAIEKNASKSADATQIAQQLSVWATDWEAGRSTAYKEYNAQYLPQSYRLFADIFNQATPEQRAFAQKKVAGYIEEITVLAARP